MPRFLRSSRLALFVVGWAAGVTLAACSAPPQKERDQAEGAVAAAKAAEAAEYAPDDLNSALESLKSYETAVAQGDYRAALNHAINARDSAYTAAKVAGDRKAAARAEAERAIVDLEGLVMVAKARLSGTPPPLPAQAAARVRAAVKRAPALLQEARTRLAKQDFKGVVPLLEPHIQALRKDLTPPGGRRGR
jgi:hypothetical protein